MIVKKIIKKVLGTDNSSAKYIEYLKKNGIEVGDHTYFFDPANTVIDIQRPWLLEIGDYCKITSGVKILIHDYSRSVLRRVYGEIVGEAGKTVIGNNVFIGMDSILLMGTCIGNNSIVGAGSVVKGTFPDNVVIAGNPARVICSLDDYYTKRKSLYVQEAKMCAQEFYKRYKRKPSIQEMGPFFPLYLKREIDSKNNVNFKLSGDDENEVFEAFLNSTPIYASYEDFLLDALGDDYA